MKKVLMEMVEKLFDAAENLTEKNFADIIKLAEEVKLDIIFVKYGYEHGSDIIWNAGVIVSPSPRFNHIYGSIKDTTDSEALNRILEFALQTARDEADMMYPVHECLPDNCELVTTESGVQRYAVKDLEKLGHLELEAFSTYLDDVLSTRVLGG